MAWLDGHADRSVVYVSLGSLAIISLKQFTEFLSGLIGTGYAFLWVLQPDMVGASQRGVLQEAIDAAGNDKVQSCGLRVDYVVLEGLKCKLTATYVRFIDRDK
jgi:hypothetical protein